MTHEKEQKSGAKTYMDWGSFMVSHPPSHEEPVDVLGCIGWTQSKGFILEKPEITLYCEICDGDRIFRSKESLTGFDMGAWHHYFIGYTCKNCEKQSKTYALRMLNVQEDDSEAGQTFNFGRVIKLGEYPAFRPHVPSHVLKLFDDKEKLFKNGLSAESQNLGVGAFAYYRQIVERHKDILVEKIIEAAKKEGVSQETIQKFEAAKSEHSFMKAVEMIEDVLPASLIIDGHNPLKALHSALSEGLHARTDSECLALAQIIREVLVGLSERIAEVLVKHTAFHKAVGKLLNMNGQAKKKETDEVGASNA